MTNLASLFDFVSVSQNARDFVSLFASTGSIWIGMECDFTYHLHGPSPLQLPQASKAARILPARIFASEQRFAGAPLLVWLNDTGENYEVSRLVGQKYTIQRACLASFGPSPTISIH
jgi:hypothetical protein